MSGKADTGEEEPIQPRPTPLPSGLARAVGRMPPPVFAIVDGGHFDNLPFLLSEAGLGARSLFLGHGDRDVERFGPWFVRLQRPNDAGAVLGIVGDLPAVVFWSCPDGDVALYEHLRRINMARLPVWAAVGKDGPEPGVEADLEHEAVLFRHWDPSVLGALLPVLDEGQSAASSARRQRSHSPPRTMAASSGSSLIPSGRSLHQACSGLARNRLSP